MTMQTKNSQSHQLVRWVKKTHKRVLFIVSDAVAYHVAPQTSENFQLDKYVSSPSDDVFRAYLLSRQTFSYLST